MYLLNQSLCLPVGAFCGLVLCAAAWGQNAPQAFDALCKEGGRAINLLPKTGVIEDQGSTGTCVVFGACAAAESGRASASSSSLSELYVILKQFEMNPPILEEQAQYYWSGRAAGILFDFRMLGTMNSMQRMGKIPVSKNPKTDPEVIAAIEKDLRALPRDTNQYMQRIRQHLESKRDLWSWDDPGVVDLSQSQVRALPEIPFSSEMQKNRAHQRNELRHADGIISTLLAAGSDPRIFNQASLENVARLSPEDFQKFVNLASELRCTDAPCRANIYNSLLNIRHALRHFTALKLAYARGEYRVPVSMPHGIDDPAFRFPDSESVRQGLATAQVCDPKETQAIQRALLAELCEDRAVLTGTVFTYGLEAAVNDSDPTAPSGWKSQVHVFDDTNLRIIEDFGHSKAVVGFDPQDGGFFILKNSWGPGEGVLKLPANLTCHLERGAVFDRKGSLPHQPIALKIRDINHSTIKRK
jgi:hypothetical protein